MMSRMFRLLTAEEIEAKVKQVKASGLVLLLYKTARTDMDLLDETVGPGNWINDYQEIKGNLYAGIGIRVDGDKFVWKWDCGVESREDGEGNEKKGEASDAFKRAGFRWGIGRELYTSPFIWIPAEKAQISGNKCYDKFSVEKINYDSSGRITSLAIRNDTMSQKQNRRVLSFVWQSESVRK